MRYYLNTDTGVVHLQAQMPRPARGNAYSNCGRAIQRMQQIIKPTSRKSVRVCDRCKQLTVSDFDE